MSRISGQASATSKKGGSKAKKRSWTDKEEDALVAAFKDIIGDGWRAQNGYKSGFLGQLEMRMRDALPTTDIRADPHISSKYTSWKRHYYMIVTALSKSGWNWNSSTHTVEAEPDQWEDFLKQFRNHHVIRGRSFPLYNEWQVIFGKDKATGKIAHDFSSMNAEETVNIDTDEEETEASSYKPDDVPIEDGNESHAGTPIEKTTKSTGSKKRRKAEHNDDVLVGAITSFCQNTAASMEKVANRMGFEFEASRRRADLYDAVGLLPMDISEDDQMSVCYKIAKDKEAMDMFFGLSMGGKMNMVNMVMKGKLK